MTTEQALKVLDDVTKSISASREVHQTILLALQTIQKALENGKGQSILSIRLLYSQAIVELATNAYLKFRIANSINANNLLVTELNMIVEALN